MMIQALHKVIKRMRYPLEVMLTCVRWYAAYPLSLRHIEEMMAERGLAVDHATVHRWAIKRVLRPMLGFKTFRCARALIAGIETMHMIRKGQLDTPEGQASSAASQFYSLAF